MEPIINSSLPEFKVQAFHNGSFKTVSSDDVKGKWAIFFSIRPIYVRLPDRAGRYRREVRAVSGDGRRSLFREHRFPFRTQGMARRLG